MRFGDGPARRTRDVRETAAPKSLQLGLYSSILARRLFSGTAASGMQWQGFLLTYFLAGAYFLVISSLVFISLLVHMAIRLGNLGRDLEQYWDTVDAIKFQALSGPTISRPESHRTYPLVNLLYIAVPRFLRVV